MNCAFEILSPGVIRCRECGFERDWKRADVLPKRMCRPGAALVQGPSLARRARNFAGALAQFVAEPGFVSRPEYERRLTVCGACPENKRDGDWCKAKGCGCYLPVKAAGKAWDCPIKAWGPYAVNRLNLIYHVAPFRDNDNWRRNIAQLRRRWHVFTGRKIVGIAYGCDLEQPETVQAAFPDDVDGWIIRPNSVRDRELATFPELLAAVESSDPTEATFYGHAKGVRPPRTADKVGIVRWRNLMYAALLDCPDAIRWLLERNAMVGTHRTRHPGGYWGFGPVLKAADWHFSGTFYWLRHSDFFATDWRRILAEKRHGWLTEALPGLLFPAERCACVAYEGCPSPYDRNQYPADLDDPADLLT